MKINDLGVMKHLFVSFSFFACLFIITGVRAYSQALIPEILEQGKLTEQFSYLEEKTRIYENYRAIREDMFQLISKNSTDSLEAANTKIITLRSEIGYLNSRMDSLNNILITTKDDLAEAVRTKNRIKILGININKYAYNAIMWILTGVLGFMLVTGLLTFRRNLKITSNTRKEFDELRDEFETYKKKSRLEREKMSLEHFNEIKKLKGK